MQDLYKVLEISADASEEEIKASYRKLAKKYHPDTHPNNAECEARFRMISEAYSVLGNAQKRKAYDAQYQSIQNKREPKRNGYQMNRNTKRTMPNKVNPLDTTDMFEKFMGFMR